MQNREFASVYQIIRSFNRGTFRRTSIPQELVSGWPAIEKLGKTLCVTIPYYAQKKAGETICLYPLYCSATVPLGNSDMLMDYTLYPTHPDWQELDWSKPAGTFPHQALAGVRRPDYQAMCRQLYGYYDELAGAMVQNKPFGAQHEMIALFCRLMEPGQYPQYLRINRRFYSFFCPLSKETDFP